MTVAVADWNVAEVLKQEDVQSRIDKIKEALLADPHAVKLMEAAQTVEDVYNLIKDSIKVKFEDFKVIFDKTVNFYKESKVELDDAVMDSVVGGGWWSNFWNEHKNGIICAGIFLGCLALGGVTGLAAGAFIGEAVMGTLAGVVVGFNMGGIVSVGWANAQERACQ